MKDNIPHGGELINRVVSEDKRDGLEEESRKYKKLILNEREISDLYMISIGCFSPLKGFMNKSDYINVMEHMRLKDGIIWPIPITLSISEEEKKDFLREEFVSLVNPRAEILGVLSIDDIYEYDKEKEAELVYGTKNSDHPGVAYVYSQEKYLIGGEVILINEPIHNEFKNYWFTPSQTRDIFREKGWKSVVGFQTRNPIHRAHEFIIKTALEIVDGLFLNPLVGNTKKGDIPADMRIRCYEVIIDNYFPKERVFMGVYGAAMRYAGPREAVLHALVRKNFGCTHFIVGRDHAGVGNFYGPYDAQKIFDNFDDDELGIIPLFFENAFYCRKCSAMATIKTCPHNEDERFFLSGTKVRELLSQGELPPLEFTRPEVANILLNWWREKKR